MSEQTWYYVRGAQRFGPVSKEEITRLLVSGELTLDDLVWSEGMKNWAPAREVPELRAFQPAAIIQFAGFWPRFAAFLIDQLILAAGGFAIGLFIALVLVFLKNEESDEHDLELMLRLGGILLAWVYYATMESSSWRATLGKRAIGLTVVDYQGNRISFARATGRHFAKIVSGLILGIGFLMAGFTQKKQALHDMMAKCLVIRSR